MVFDRFWKRISADLWDRDLREMNRVEAGLYHLLRFSQMAGRQFRRDHLQLHAASLTFNTLLALVPLLTLGFAVLKGLGYGDEFLVRIQDTIATFPDQVRTFLEKVMDTVINTDFAKLGGIGGVILLVLIVQVLGRIESSINLVWGIIKQRNLMQKMTSYISVTIIVPILIMAAVTLNRLFEVESLPFVSGLLPFVSSCLTLTLLYLLFPNTRVRFAPALVSGFFTAVLFQIWFKFYALVQPGVTNYNVIYGTLASIPIFLAWLYISWMIVLVGVELSFAMQNYSAFRNEMDMPDLSLKSRVELAMMILLRAAEAMTKRGDAFQIRRFSEIHGVPFRYLFAMAQFLEEQGYLVETVDSNGTYVLKVHPEKVELGELVLAIYENGASLKANKFSNTIHQATDAIEAHLARFFNKKTLAQFMAQSNQHVHDPLGRSIQDSTSTT